MIGQCVDVWQIPLARAAAEIAMLHSLLDSDERIHASRFHFERDRNRFVVARATMRLLLASYSGVDPRRVKFIVRSGGKPSLACESPDDRVHFNLSHSGDLALCAISDSEVGIDCEQIKQHDDVESVARNFFSRDEADALGALSGADRTRFFFRTWVRKEAYIKATGEGLSRDTRSFTVQGTAAGVTLHDADGSSRTDNSYRVYDLPDIGDNFAALALAGSGATPARYRRLTSVDADFGSGLSTDRNRGHRERQLNEGRFLGALCTSRLTISIQSSRQWK